MNAVEIEIAISDLAQQPFDKDSFPYEFLRAFGNKETTIKKLKSGSTNKSDIGGVLQRNNIHLAVSEPGSVSETLSLLRQSPANEKNKVKFLLATDGENFEAIALDSGETLACRYEEFPNHFGFFLQLAGISTVKQIRDSSFDIRATSRLNRLYVELLKDNPEWASAEQCHEMNHFMARLIFCFFAEDTAIFKETGLFTTTVEQMSSRDSSNTHEVISEIFRAMNIKPEDRKSSRLRPWADKFDYVNGGLFSGSNDVPRFSKIARSYLLHIGHLDWTQINPDIFGSMIQAVADDEERGELGMHYTSVPNILKVLNPLFLDDLRGKLEEAGDNARKLLNLRKRIAHIRIFDPACGSGNFLVIAYKQLRDIENSINERRGEAGRKSDIPLNNFRGIELRGFSAEIARLALIIAEYQCDVRYRGQKEALVEFLPLNNQNWIIDGNALEMDWEQACPAEGRQVKFYSDDLFKGANQSEIHFENEGGEVYICGNPPYLGSTWQSSEQKADLKAIFDKRTKSWKSLDYVAGWFMKAADYCARHTATAAFVSTNSICQGQQVPILWPVVFATGCQIEFAHTSFKWTNLAANNAGVTVAIIGLSANPGSHRRLFAIGADGETVEKQCSEINAYLVAGKNILVNKRSKPFGELHDMSFGNKPVDGGNLLLSAEEAAELNLSSVQKKRFLRRIYGSAEFIRGLERYCLWIEDDHLAEALAIPQIAERIEAVRIMRLASKDKGANAMAASAHQMREMNIGLKQTIAMPCVSSETREFLPVGLLDDNSTVTNLAFALYDAPLWSLALIASRIHLIWIASVCGKMKTDFRYSNTMGWNTFPLPLSGFTQKNKDDLTRCAEDILLAREAHFPATIADLYKPDAMPDDLRAAHERNDEVLERIYIGRRFRNDTERLEKLFDLYGKMTSGS